VATGTGGRLTGRFGPRVPMVAAGFALLPADRALVPFAPVGA
jgi:DHA2 family methylenomycin A resistance protein-like MFS transporter